MRLACLPVSKGLRAKIEKYIFLHVPTEKKNKIKKAQQIHLHAWFGDGEGNRRTRRKRRTTGETLHGAKPRLTDVSNVLSCDV